MKLKQVRNVSGDVLEVESEPVINGRDVAKQYYALIGEKLLLIRLEDSKGKLIRNVYGAPNHTIGLNQTGRSSADWAKSLESNDRAEVLAALTWLGGIHWNPGMAAPDYLHEEMSEARLAEEVRALETVKASVNRLRHSDDAWVRDAAKLAATVVYYR
jgi:hypothetical protein